MPAHALTFQIALEDVAQGITARCLTCGARFRDATEWDGTECTGEEA